MTPSTRILQKARALVERGWTKGASARNKHGSMVFINSEKACTFCATGAVGRAHVSVLCADEHMWEALDRLSLALDFVLGSKGSVVHFNDAMGTTKEDVLLMFDLAIELEL